MHMQCETLKMLVHFISFNLYLQKFHLITKFKSKLDKYCEGSWKTTAIQYETKELVLPSLRLKSLCLVQNNNMKAVPNCIVNQSAVVIYLVKDIGINFLVK